MTGQINFVVPVAPFEPIGVIEKSVESLTDHDISKDLVKSIIYVIDVDEDIETDERVSYLREETPESVKTIARTSNDGRRAGAINRALEEMETPEYIAIFDIDSRPGPEFIDSCVDQLEERDELFMSTCPRRILNRDRNFVSKMVEVEFDFITDMQLFLERQNGFNHFNGLISVMDADYLMEEKLDEGKICEDTDFTEKAYLDGKRPAINTGSYLGEQSVTGIKDLYNQKLRWMKGALEGLRYYSLPFFRSDLPFKVKSSWFSAMTTPFFAALLSPVAFLYSLKLLYDSGDVVDSVEKGFALFFFTWLISFCGLVNIGKMLAGKGVEWKDSERENI